MCTNRKRFQTSINFNFWVSRLEISISCWLASRAACLSYRCASQSIFSISHTWSPPKSPTSTSPSAFFRSRARQQHQLSCDHSEAQFNRSRWHFVVHSPISHIVAWWHASPRNGIIVKMKKDIGRVCRHCRLLREPHPILSRFSPLDLIKPPKEGRQRCQMPIKRQIGFLSNQLKESSAMAEKKKNVHKSLFYQSKLNFIFHHSLVCARALTLPYDDRIPYSVLLHSRDESGSNQSRPSFSLSYHQTSSAVSIDKLN